MSPLSALVAGWVKHWRKRARRRLSARGPWRTRRLPLYLETLEDRTVPSTAPDLLVTAVTAPATAVAGNGARVNVSWTVQNGGTAAAAGRWTDAVYLSTKNTLDSSATSLTSYTATFDAPLAAGASYTVQQQLVVPNVPAGQEYVLVKTDANGGQPESNTGNDVMAAPVTLTAPGNVDLVVTNGNAPAQAAAGSGAAFDVSWTVKNQGTVAAAAGWSDQVYFSTRSALDTSARYLNSASENVQAPLAAGASYTDYLRVTLPNVPAGGGFLLIQTNTYGDQAESNTANDVLAVPITVTVPAVDLAVSGASVSAPTVAAGNGAPVTVTYTVTNKGTAATPTSWSDQFYLSTRSTYDDTARYLYSGDLTSQVPTTLAAGASYTVNAKVTLPARAAGSYFLLVQTDGSNTLADTDTSNNVAAIPITLTAPNVDLAVTAGTGPSSAVVGAGQFVTLSYTVKNLGTDAAAAGWTDAVYLSDSQAVDNTAQEIDNYTLYRQVPSTLAAGATYTVNITVPLTDGETGARYLLFQTNRYGSQAETSAANDVFALPITLTAPQADLAVTQTSAPASAVVGNGSSITVSWTVKNQGTDPAAAGWTDAVFLSPTPTFDPGATYFGNSFFLSSRETILQLYSATANQSPLAAGASYTTTQTLSVPNTAAGSRYLLFVTDRYDAQGETNKADNVVAVPISLTAPGADLTVTGATAPASSDEGGSVAVTWTVKDQGAGAAAAAWRDAVFVADQPALDSSYLGGSGGVGVSNYGDGTATFVGYLTPPAGGLAAGASTTGSQNITIPQTAVGNRYLVFVANADGAQSETNVLNNEFALPIALTAPDLTVTTATAPASAVEGQPFAVSWMVKNQGTVSALAHWQDAVYVSDRTTFDNTATFVESFPAPTPPLAAGATYTQNQTISIPQTAVGNRYLLFVANNGNSQPETDTTNNLFALPLALSAPDLTVTTATAPSSAIEGQPISVSWAVKNQGTVPAAASWSDEVYVSDKQTYDSTATRVESFTTPQTPLAAGASYTQAQTVSIPQTAVGSRYLLFVANAFRQQGETDTTNNTFAVPITLTAPDLTVTTASAPSSATVGDLIPVSWTVKNQGAVEAPASWQDYLYLSDKQTYDFTATYVGSFAAPPQRPLAAGASYSQSQLVTLPASAKASSRYLLVLTNPPNFFNGGGQGETDTTNNTYALPITVSAPDLIVTTASAPSSAVLGQSLAVSWAVKNQGSVTALGTWNDAIYVSDKQTYDGTATLVSSFPAAFNPLAAGDFYVQNRHVTIPQTATGARYLLFVANSSNGYFSGQGETNTANNTFAVPITLTAPDLTVTTASAPSSAVLGDSVTVTWTVKNQGGVTAGAAWNDAVYVSNSATLDSSAQRITTFAAPQTLAAGASYNQSQKVKLPQTATGARYLIVVADDNKAQGETDTTNDTFSVAVALTAPDLTVTTAGAPATATVGDSVPVTWTVKDQGGAPADATWSDALYLSTKSTYDYNARFLSSFADPQALAAGGTYNQSQNVTIPAATAPGSYFLLVVADSGQGQPETDATNDTYAVPITLAAPDLIIMSASAQPTTPEVGNGSQVTATWTVKNQGGVPAQASFWDDTVYFSTKQTYDGTARYLGSFSEGSHLPLAAGATYTDTEKLTLPVVAAGGYYLLIQTNTGGGEGGFTGQGETDTTNNWFAVPITVAVPDVKLATGNVSLDSTTLTEGAGVSYSFTVTNNGSEAASANWFDAIYVSDRPTLDGSATRITSVYLPSQSPLAAGASYTQSGTLTLPQTATGSRYLLFVADYGNEQAQSDAGKAVTAVAVTVQAPDLTITQVTAPKSGILGNTIPITWTVKNQGAVAAPAVWFDAVYLSRTQYLAQYSYPIASYDESANAGLAAGVSYTDSQTLNLPSFQTPGDYFLVFRTNYSSDQGETDTTNNTTVVPIHVTGPDADLIVTSFTAPPSAVLGASVPISYTVKNQGSQAAAAQWYDYVYLSSSQTLDSSSVFVTSIPAPQTLAAGASYTVNQNVILPSFPTGNQYLLIVTNGDYAQSETDPTNDTAAAPVTLTAPDLIVSSPQAPSSANLGDTIPVSWTVKNQGTAPAPATWHDAVYVSSSSTLDGNAQFIAAFAAPPQGQSPLAAGASYTLSENIKVPQTATGNRFLLFVTNYDQAQGESNFTNDVASLPITLSAPDLTVTAATGPSGANLGDSLAVSWTVQNVGNAPADATWLDRVYLGDNSTLSGSYTLLKSFAAPPTSPLAVNGTYMLNESVTLPASAAAGARYLLFVTDSDAGQPESNTTNDVYALPITVTAPQLTAGSFTAPASAQFGQGISLSWQVTNAGSQPIKQTWNDLIYLSSKSQLDGSAVLLDTVSASDVIPLAANGSYKRTKSETLPLNTTTTNGTYYLYVVADGNNQLAIADRTKTIASQPINLTLPPLPDLTASGLSAPAQGFTDQHVLVSWTDANGGTVTATGPWVDKLYLATDAKGSNPTLVGTATFPNALTVGQSAQLTQPIPLPHTPGTYYLVVTVNGNGAVQEGPAALNNTTVDATPINVQQAPLPDLIVTGITPPSNGVLSGASVPITFVVKNNGTAPTSVPVWQDWVILSQDPNLAQSYNPNTGYDQILNNQPVILGFGNPSYLDVGQSYSQAVNVPLPISAQGTWYVYVVPDGTGSHHPFAMPELSRDDKLTLSSGFSVTLSPPPDLAVTGVQTPSQAFSGQSMNVTWNVANNGTGPTAVADWTDAVYMSSKSTLDSSATLLGTFGHQGVLAAGSNYSETQPVNLPVGVSGAFYFLVKTDLNADVFENGATSNNVGGTPSAVTVNLTPPPDLAVTTVTAPATALASHALTFTYHVANQGAGATPNSSWVDSYYLSPTATYDPKTAVALGQQTHQGSLAAGVGFDSTVTETLPNGLSGTYYLIVDTDSANAVFELNKTNNFGATSGTTQVSSKPADLALTAASAPAVGLASGAVLVNWTVANQGTGDTVTTSWQDNVYADTGATLDGKAILLTAYEHDGLLNAGDSYTQSRLVTLPITLSGAYNLFVVTNQPLPGQNTPPVYETNTANDTSAAVPITVSQKLADLQVTAVTAPATAATGGSVTVSWTVQNNGTATTNSNYWYDDVWLSTKATLGSGGSDVYLGTVQHSNPLAAGASYNASATLTLPQGLATGNYSFIVATDRPVAPSNGSQGVNLVYESNETNNETAATPATAVSLGGVPDLAVSNVTVPATATSGTQLPVTWTVTNNGAATGNVPITDSVYLSYDQVLDPSDRFIGSATFTGGLAANGSYTQTNVPFELPAGLAGTFYVFVVTNSDNNIYERNTANNAVDDATPLPVQLPAPADLVAGTVTVPANAVPGQDFTITYQVTNNGTSPANGAWYDSLYLSPTPTWSVNDPLLKRVYQQQDLAANGGSYTDTVTAPLPAVTAGSYYVILRTNILNSFPELTQGNNLSASVTQSAIDAPALTLGTPATGTLGDGQAAYYKVVVTAGQTLQIRFSSQTTNTANQLYVSYSTTPTLGHFDFSAGQQLQTNEQVTIPTTQAGTYYVLAYGASVPSTSENYSITAALVPFAVQAVSPGQVGTGPVTVEIDGSQFDNHTTFQLQGPNGTVVNGQTPLLQDGSTAFVTFDLTGRPTGTYGVQAARADGTTAQLAGGLTVVAASPAHVQFHLSTPSIVLPASQGSVTVNYVNDGNTDAVVPLLGLAANNARVRLAGQDTFTGNSVEFLAISATGPAGVLRPGESGQIQIPYQVTGTTGQNIDMQLLSANDSQTIDWASQEDALRPSTIPADAWGAVFANLIARLGSTTASYRQVLVEDAAYLSRFGEYVTDPATLLSFEVTKANDGYTPVTLASNTDTSYAEPGMSLVFQRTFNSSISGRYLVGPFGRGWGDNWQLAVTTDAQGNATVQNGGQFAYFALQAGGSYRAGAGNHSVLSRVNGAFQLRQPDGALIAFNSDGPLNYEQDTNGNRITVGYTNGLLTSLRHSDGQALTIGYNAQGLISSITDPASRVSSYTYDAAQHLVTYTDPTGTTTYGYVGGQSAAQNNALASITFPGNTHIFYSYDGQGRLKEQSLDGGADDLKYSYLSPGGYVVTDAGGRAATRFFDAEGNTTETITPLGEAVHYTYNSINELVSLTGPLGSTYSFRYDSQGNLTGSVDPLGRQIGYTFNANNHLTSFTDAKGNTTKYQPDSHGNVLSITYADGTTRQTTYDPLGQAQQFLTASGTAIGYGYNAQGLLTTETFADGSSFTYTYDSRQNLTGAADSQGHTTTFKYDPVTDNLVEVDSPGGHRLNFQYDAAGNRKQSVDETGFTINYAYDGTGELKELTDGGGNRIVLYSYDGAGNLTRKDMGNGTATTYTYDADGDVLSITNLAPGGAVNSYDNRTYDAWGRTLTDASQNGTWTYTYDLGGELTGAAFASGNTAVLPDQNIQYVYDAAGNRVSQTVNGVTTTYAVNAVNEYTSTTTSGAVTNYHYDAEGNLTSVADAGGTTSYTYNQLNQLTGISGPGLSAAYSYDPLGSRVAQTVNGAATAFQVDPTGMSSVVAAYDGGGSLQTHYVYALGLVSQVGAGNPAAYYDFDSNGSAVGITGAGGTYVNQYAYQPFGATTTLRATVANPFTYVAQAGVSTDATGTFSMRNRTYAPNLGQFLTVDPLGIFGGLNTRAYTSNEPVDFSDPIGLCQTVTVYIWRGKHTHAAIDVSGDVLDKRPIADPYQGNPTHPATYNWNESVPPDASYSFNVDDSTAEQMHNQIDYEKQQPYWNRYVNNCSEGVTSVLYPRTDKAGLDPTLSGLAPFWLEPWLQDHLEQLQDPNCPPPPGPAKHGPWNPILTDIHVPIGGLHDPNSLIGPAGFGDQKFVTPDQVLPYTIEFENEPTATLPAQQVVVTQQLDPGLNWASFRLGSFGFGGTTYQVPDNVAFYQTRLDLTRQDGFYLDVTGTIDERTGIATWTFTTVDPNTGQIPLDPRLGFLPPDTANGVGQGFVSYTVTPTQSDATGTVLKARATITFYGQAPLDTPQIANTIDAGTGLTSTVAALPPYQTAATFNVSWSGSDGTLGSAISGYTIYVSDNGGPFAPWLSNTTLTSAPYTGQDGHSYGFYSVATDNAGNTQPTPTQAQTTTLVDLTAPTSTVAALPTFTNTAGFTVSWSGTDGASGSGIASFQVFVSDNGAAYTLFKQSAAAGSATFTGQDGHSYAFYSVATDNAGNVQPAPTAAQASTLVDVTAPTSTVTALPVAVNSLTFSVSWSGSDGANGSGIASFQVFVSDNGAAYTLFKQAAAPGSATFAGQDSHTYAFYSVATDKAGNVQPTPSQAQATTLVDTDAPTSTVAALPAAVNSLSFTVSWSGQDNTGGSGIASFQVFVSDNGGAYTSFKLSPTAGSATFTGQDGHTYGFYSVATDKAGNVQPTPSQAQATTLVDTDAPTSTVAALPAAVSSTTFTVSWSGQDNPGGSGLAGFQVFVSDNGAAYTLFQQIATAGSAQFTGQDGHTYGFYSVATDNAGNVQPKPSSPQATTLVDLDAPTSSVAALPAAVNTATFTVSWSGSDGANGSGIASFQVFVSDNGAAFTLFKQAAAPGSATFAGQDGHTYAFYSVATDKAGNVQPTPSQAQATTLVDLVAPTSTVAALPATTNSLTFAVSWSGQDNPGGSGIASFQVFVSDNGASYTLFKQSATAGSAQLTGQDGHTYGFYSVATDKAGNTQAAPAQPQATILVDVTPPTSTVTSPVDVNALSFSVSWSGSDGAHGSGIAAFQVFVSDNGGAYTSFKLSPTAGSAQFTGQVGHGYAFYSVATDKAGNVQPTPTAAQASTIVGQYGDNFNRADSSTLGSTWAQVQGGMGIKSNRLLVGGTGAALAIFKPGGLQTTTAVSAAIALSAGGATQYAGLVVRYGGSGSYYLGEIVASGGKYTAYLFRDQGGTFTLLGTGTAAGGVGTLLLEAVGDSLQLSLNGQLLASAADATFASGATGVWGSPGATLDDFVGGPVALNTASLPFADSFTQPDGSALSLSWTPQTGSFLVNSGRLQGTTAGSLATVNLAAVGAGNVGVQADIALSGSQYAGVVARVAGPGSYYLGQVVGGGANGFTAYLFKFVNGAPTQLATPVKVSGGTGTLRLEAVGSSIKLFFGGQLALYAFDSTPALASGTVGVWATTGATLDNFAADAISTASVPLPFNDSFTQADGTQLSRSWTEQSGNFSVQNDQLRANAGGSLATLNQSAPAANVGVQADLALTGAQYAGVVARVSGPGSYYLGQVVGGASGFTAYLFKFVNGTPTQLATPVKVSGGTGTLRLEAVGSSIKLFFGGQLALYGFDSTPALASGTTGLWATTGATLDNFSAGAISPSTASLPFSDSFPGSNGTPLSRSWTEQEGNFSVQGGKLRANDPGVSLATVNLASAAADVAVQANIALGTTGTQYAGLVARYSGTGDGNMYLAEVVGSKGKYTAYIFRHVGSTWTPLKSFNLTSGTGLLLFTVKGSRLTLSFNGQVVCDVIDAAPLVGGGLAGLRAGQGALYGNFFVTAS